MRAAAVLASAVCCLLLSCTPDRPPLQTKSARRVILVYINTLRTDHLGVFGYERKTTPAMDAFARRAVSFDHALTTAPWSLPAARSLLTGRQPEEYDSARTLSEILGSAGFSTALFSAAPALSADYDMQRGWDILQVALKAPAATQVDLALEWLELVRGQNAFVVVHLADTQFPYQEPASYRRLFAGDPQAPFGETLSENTAVDARVTDRAARQYLIDRHDNALRYLDDELARLFAALEEDDLVFLFSGHGEEFWDHASFGHGHSLHEEVLRVPLLIRAPGLEPHRVSAPVSLLDLTPTILDLLGMDRAEYGFDGISLVPVMNGEPDAEEQLSERCLAFGRPLFGPMRWGIVSGALKYSTSGGEEMLFDLSDDPLESNNLLVGKEWTAGAIYRRKLGEALGRDIAVAFQLDTVSPSQPAPQPVKATLSFAGNAALVWVVDQPAISALSWAWKEDGNAVARWEAGFRQARRVLAVPENSIDVASRKIALLVDAGEQHFEIPVQPTSAQRRGTDRRPLARTRLPGGLRMSLDYCIAALPAEDTGRMPRLSVPKTR